LDLGDGTGHLYLWVVSKLYGDRDRIPDTNDGGEPTIRSEVSEFRFPLSDLHATPSLEYGDVRIGKHVDGPLTLSNRGLRPVEFTSMELPDSMLTTPVVAPFSVPALGQLQLHPRFAPTSHASFDGSMNLGTSALQQPLTVFMSGRGVAPILQVTPMSLDLGSAPVGFFTASQRVEVANVGDDYLEVSWEFKDALQQFGFSGYIPPADGPYPFELYPGDKQNFNLAFNAIEVGAAEGIFQVLSDDELSPRVDVHLKATGTPPESRISIFYTYEDPIRDVPIGGEGSSPIRIDNGGSAPLNVSAVTSSNPLFTASVNPNPIPPKQLGFLTVTYHPVAWGLETTTITITHNDPTRPPVTLMIGGRAFEPPPVAQVTPTTLDFGSLHQGTTATLSFEIRNVGAGPLHLTGYNPLLPSYCAAQTDLIVPATILPGAALRANVTYAADIANNTQPACNFYFFTNDPALYQVNMQILATILSPEISFGDYNLNFPNTPLGNSSTGMLTAYNLGPEPLIISRANFYNSVFSLSTALPLTIPPGGNAELEFVYTPSYLYSAYESVTLETNDLDNRLVYLYLYGYGLPASSVRSRSLNP